MGKTNTSCSQNKAIINPSWHFKEKTKYLTLYSVLSFNLEKKSAWLHQSSLHAPSQRTSFITFQSPNLCKWPTLMNKTLNYYCLNTWNWLKRLQLTESVSKNKCGLVWVVCVSHLIQLHHAIYCLSSWTATCTKFHLLKKKKRRRKISLKRKTNVCTKILYLPAWPFWLRTWVVVLLWKVSQSAQRCHQCRVFGKSQAPF